MMVEAGKLKGKSLEYCSHLRVILKCTLVGKGQGKEKSEKMEGEEERKSMG